MEQINDKKICIVCGKEIKEIKIVKQKGLKKIVDIYTYISVGNNQFRHRKCAPGSKNWKLKFPDSELGNLLYKHLNHKRRKNSMERKNKERKDKEEFGYVDLVMATKEINECLTLDPPIDLELPQEKLIEELKECYKLTTPEEKFSELVENCWVFIGVKEKIINNEKEKDEEMKKESKKIMKRNIVKKEKVVKESLSLKMRGWMEANDSDDKVIDKAVKILESQGKDSTWALKRAKSKLRWLKSK